jgi:hypothetical protein
VTWDSAHYLSFTAIINGDIPMDSWDVVRGPTYPFILWLSIKMLGMTTDAMLLVHYAFYIATLCLYYLIAKKILPLNTASKKLSAVILIYIIIGLNPLIFGYYHVLLTEYLASFFVALIIYFAINYYFCLKNDKVDKKYRTSQLVLILSCPILFFLKQNYLMLLLGAIIAIVALTILQRCGKKITLRAFRLLLYTVMAFFTAFSVWNAMLPEAEADYMSDWTSESLLIAVLIPDTAYINYIDDDEGMVVAFYDKNNNPVNTYITHGITSKNELSVANAMSISIKNFFRHPLLVISGVLDSYLSGIGVYSANVAEWRVQRVVSIHGADENSSIGYYILSPYSQNVLRTNPRLTKYAEPFERESFASPTITGAISRMVIPTNLVFSIGFLLLPPVWIGSIVLLIRYKKEMNFSISFISATISLGYLFLNSIAQLIIDRYNFPIFISAWIAIFSLLYGIVQLRYTAKTQTLIASDNCEAIQHP